MSVRLELIKVSDGSLIETISSGLDANGNLTWEIPNTLTGIGPTDYPLNARIDITETTPDGTEVSHTGQTFVIYQSTGFTQIQDQLSADSFIRLFNHGDILRISRGLTASPQVYQYINRDFFWDANEGAYTNFNLDTATPRRLSESSIIRSSNNSGWFYASNEYETEDGMTTGSLTAFHDLSNKTYYYKCSFVYDGIQEGPLDTFLGDTSGNTNTESVPSIGLHVTATESDADYQSFNKRITGINIYRSTQSNGVYYKIGSVSTLATDPNRTHITSGVYPSDSSDTTYSYVYLNGVTSEYANKLLLFSGWTVPIHSSVDSSHTKEIHRVGSLENNPTGNGYSQTGSLQLVSKAQRLWNDSFTIIESNLHTQNTNGSFHSTTGGSFTDWEEDAFSPTTPVHNTTFQESFTGHGALGLTGGSGTVYSPVYDVDENTEYYFEIWATTYQSSANAGDLELKMRAHSTGTANQIAQNGTVLGSVSSTITTTNKDTDTYRLGNGKTGWEKLSIRGTTGSGQVKLTIEFNVDSQFVADAMSVGKFLKSGTEGFGGVDTVVFTEPKLGTNNSHQGWTFQHGLSGTSTRYGWIYQNTDKAIQFYKSTHFSSTSTTFPYNESTYTGELSICNNYQWRDVGDYKLLTFYDKGLQDGVVHPYDETKIDTYYKYSTLSDGRLFAGNVALDPTGENELHKDWIIYSELGQFDVLPITNYIQLNDKQGGEITGLETLLGDVVVFMSRGIYRINVPSADPTQWSLVEAEENIGCTAPDSIIKNEGNLFFANESDIYFLDANFNAVPITGPIRDDYQALANANTILHLDPKKDRLLCKFGDEVNIIYAYSLKDNGWSKLNAGSEKTNLFAIDENLVTYTLEHEVQTSENDTSFNSLDPTTPVEVTDFVYETGWIPISDMEFNKIIRSLDIRYTAPSGIVAEIYTDDNDTKVRWTSNDENGNYRLIGTNKIDSFRVGVRAKNYKLKIYGPQDVSTVEIGRIEVDVDE
tara:strand:+ start:10554 stop:13520 length:2967 start_codon:yes stop_codon:yes gene_type:complete